MNVITKYFEEIIIPKFETKNAFFGIFDQKCLTW